VTVPALDATAAEFGLGHLLDTAPVPGHPDVFRITTERGTFLARPAGPADPALYEQVAVRLARAGIRQAMPVRTTTGALASESGLVVHEFLPGATSMSPSPAQTLATMGHIAAYHEALRDFPAPVMAQNLWTRVMSPEYLLAELPPLRLGDAVQTALDQLARALPLIAALPRQLIHGDIGPDNVLMDGDDVVAIIDFTPHVQPVLSAVATAVYWYHVHGRDKLDPDAAGASLAAAGPWTSTEQAAWPAMLTLEALRRLATPYALAAENGTPPPSDSAAVTRRLDAVRVIVRDWQRR
jgi:Ser/Thr protein kinase RdoA (MazF antagonist)